ncbi:hypothetical protein ScPMuIL_015290 [Solemya velum]
MSVFTISSDSSETVVGSVDPTPIQTGAKGVEASSEAINFLETIDPEADYKYLLFNDDLVTVSDTGKELGEFSVSVEPTKHRGYECFLIHANSHGSIDNVPCGTSITCYVTKNLETIEQQHHEYVKLENCPLDRKTFINKENNNYNIKRVITQGEEIQRSAKTLNETQMKGFISEGANLLLHRLLIERTMPENFRVISFDSETNLSQVVYRSLEDRTQTVNNIELQVFGIERTINSIVDLPTSWQSYFMNDGHLTNRVQVGSPVTMKLIRVPQLIERDEEPPKPTFDKQPLNWEEDMDLYSQFMERKEELKGDHASYMRSHPELKALLADFLQFLLLRKPDDIISFAGDYFSSFSQAIESTTPYLTSSAPTPYLASRTNTFDRFSSSQQ